MQRLRLKADGRIVELRDGQEFPLAPAPVLANAGSEFHGTGEARRRACGSCSRGFAIFAAVHG